MPLPCIAIRSEAGTRTKDVTADDDIYVTPESKPPNTTTPQFSGQFTVSAERKVRLRLSSLYQIDFCLEENIDRAIFAILAHQPTGR